MKITTLHDMFVHTLKDIHYAETKILKALPKMIKAAQNADLTEALVTHKAETEGQIERIKQVFGLLGMKPSAVECDAINGILKEAEGMLEDTAGQPMSDTGVIASGQAVEHYEIVRYRSLVMWAGALGLEKAAEWLQLSLDEERAADEKLNLFAAYCQTEPGTMTAADGKPSVTGEMKGQAQTDKAGGSASRSSAA